jgi:predicted GNAT family acetyltransferase
MSEHPPAAVPASPSPADVRHDPQRHCFELRVEGRLCRADYRMVGRAMVVHHTEVPPALEGRGLASVLVRAVFDHAGAAGLTVTPLCSYVRAWARRHPEVTGLLS